MAHAQRDPETTKKQLAEWLATRDGVDDPEVLYVDIPTTTGWSNETLLFTARWDGTEHHLVARVEPTAHTVFLEANFESQYRVMKALAEGTDVPMPALHWFEPDRAWLGGAFWIMDRVDGDVPQDNPPYTMDGWVLQSPPEDQARLWWSGVDAMARVHRADWRALGLGFLDDPGRGPTGIGQQLAYYAEYLEWAEGGSVNPTARRGLGWLRANQPPAGDVALCWGDARISNQMFRDHRVVAVLDWEMVALGDPQQDLAWWLVLDRLFSEGLGVARVPGFPSDAETVARWEDLTGRTADALGWYEVFALFRFTVIMTRLGKLWAELGLAPNDDMATDNFVANHLARVLEETP